MMTLFTRSGVQPLYDFCNQWKNDEEELSTTTISELFHERKDLDIGLPTEQEYLVICTLEMCIKLETTA